MTDNFKVTEHASLQDFRKAQEYDALCRRIIELENNLHERIDKVTNKLRDDIFELQILKDALTKTDDSPFVTHIWQNMHKLEERQKVTENKVLQILQTL